MRTFCIEGTIENDLLKPCVIAIAVGVPKMRAQTQVRSAASIAASRISGWIMPKDHGTP